MLCKIPDIADGVISLFASGRLSTEDYGQIMQPMIENYHGKTGKVCLYVEADVLLEGWDHQSLTGSGEVQLPQFDALVLVGGPDWFGNAVRLLGPFMQGEVAWFPLGQKLNAVDWVATRTGLTD
ncbi:SpoIIAA family protein [Shewanella youngdeokensis]|uniref:STAS/SEC14 domain-containing protein n=1 Tax=Shewanella youngdeokensis TaxID=2999068 RepID=A0ABZ0JZ84_9GAMM|nr:STAS/SEC14 domain-containing protein [Shewanella sp. DAU334]